MTSCGWIIGLTLIFVFVFFFSGNYETVESSFHGFVTGLWPLLPRCISASFSYLVLAQIAAGWGGGG